MWQYMINTHWEDTEKMRIRRRKKTFYPYYKQKHNKESTLTVIMKFTLS